MHTLFFHIFDINVSDTYSQYFYLFFIFFLIDFNHLFFKYNTKKRDYLDEILNKHWINQVKIYKITNKTS